MPPRNPPGLPESSRRSQLGRSLRRPPVTTPTNPSHLAEVPDDTERCVMAFKSLECGFSGTRCRGAGTFSETSRGIAFAQPLATVCEPGGFGFSEWGDYDYEQISKSAISDVVTEKKIKREEQPRGLLILLVIVISP